MTRSTDFLTALANLPGDTLDATARWIEDSLQHPERLQAIDYSRVAVFALASLSVIESAKRLRGLRSHLDVLATQAREAGQAARHDTLRLVINMVDSVISCQ